MFNTKINSDVLILILRINIMIDYLQSIQIQLAKHRFNTD